MTTFADLIHKTRSHLMTGKPDILNVLDSDVLANATSLPFRFTVRGVDVGTRLVIGLEEYHVVESPSTSNPGTSITVLPAQNGSSSTAHTGGDVIYVAPQFSAFRISQELNVCLASLPGEGLWRIKTLDFDFNPAQAGYNFTSTDVLDIWRVKYDYPGAANNWPVLEPRDYRLDQNADTSEFPGGKMLVLLKGGAAGHTVRVSYRASFAPLVNLADDVEVVAGLPLSSHDIPPLGAAIRLLAGRDVKRSFLTQQPEPRRQDEVPPGAATQAMTPLLQQYYAAINREMRVLLRKYPQQV